MAEKLDPENLLAAVTPLLAGPPLPDAAVGQAFADAMRALARFDHAVVFAYRGHERPLHLYSTFDAPQFEIFVTLYQAGPFLLDPFFHAARAQRSGLWRMRELAPDRFFSSEYFRTYYAQTKLAEEIGFFVPVGSPAGGEVTVALSLMRNEASRAFSAGELRWLGQAEPFVVALTRTFWSGLAERFGAAGVSGKPPPEARAETVWRKLDLTRREAAIVELVLQGHSSEAIGRRLGISTGTVKVHRRNVYRKLNITSQTQLFSLCLRSA
ncbi:MAG TPA: helix-turn-helix transcriptional regulator [Mesorhizobium sp.]|jgi:DNA-binding CsgD family transcriptional regulator|nr:helix-turn-helix transcriptional regulator [Mesorhizobium sp.]